ncbi:hypothetical protein AAY473_002937 [Plecturocebus cupreus]
MNNKQERRQAQDRRGPRYGRRSAEEPGGTPPSTAELVTAAVTHASAACLSCVCLIESFGFWEVQGTREKTRACAKEALLGQFEAGARKLLYFFRAAASASAKGRVELDDLLPSLRLYLFQIDNGDPKCQHLFLLLGSLV